MPPKAKSHTHSLFKELLGSRSHLEVNLSKAFSASFRDSGAFRRAIIQLLCRTCGTKSIRSEDWVCRTEVALDNAGRADIHVRPAGNDGPVFQIESKVGAPLTKAQLGRYRLSGTGKYLVAVTKRRPEVTLGWIRQQGAFALRWQDVHRELSHVPARGADAYICRSFCHYLEELGMAHREDISSGDLERLHRLLNRISNTRFKTVDMKPANAFQVADSCLALLDDVVNDSIEEAPQLQKGWVRYGPTYYKVKLDGVFWHYLAFRFRRNRWSEWFGAGFCFQDGGEKPFWEVGGETRHGYAVSTKSATQVCDRSGVLDREKMLKSFLKAAGIHGVKS